MMAADPKGHIHYDVERGELYCDLCGAHTWRGVNVPHTEDCPLYIKDTAPDKP